MFKKSIFLLLPLLLTVNSFCKDEGNMMTQLNLMPLPWKVIEGEGKFRVDNSFTAAVETPSNIPTDRAFNALRRTLQRLAGRTGIFFSNNDIDTGPKTEKTEPAKLTITFKRTGKLELNEDETYKLTVTQDNILLSAPTDTGVLRGLETLLQLLNIDDEGYFFPGLTIDDKPRFPWRGLLIDSCRHFLPLDVIKRNLDGMAAVKMNVLHWHLTEDQGFRVECKTFPKLHQLGSDGFYYTQEQIREVIAYAADRGIRVMPEFDIPGHSTSWLVGYPELGSAPGPYSIERKYGVFNPTFNPTLKGTYTFFDAFFKEMAALFPDNYIHIGGDENNGADWDANPQIQEFKKKHNLPDNHALQAHFNKKILDIITKYKKQMVGWDEIFQPGLPRTIVIQSWRGKEAIREAARKGYNTILSNGYYIDLCQDTAFHYLNDPLPADSDLTDAEKERILGGEATMWAELVSPETVDSRIWPRTAAVAERLWSSAFITDVDDMYRRLDVLNLQLEELGLMHIRNQAVLLRRLTAGADVSALKVLVDVVEPLKIYNRHNQGVTYTIFSPLTRLVDAALPDAKKARLFRQQTAAFLKNPGDKDMADDLLKDLSLWKENHEKLLPVIRRSPVLKEIETLSLNLSTIARIGIEAVRLILDEKETDTGWLEESKKALESAKLPGGHAELTIVTAIEQLVENVKK